MRKIKEFIDERQRFFNRNLCAYCGRSTESRDHVPSKAFLNRPYPADLHTVAACNKCNRDFSKDEQYTMCLLECVLAGSTNWEDMERAAVARTLRKSPRLTARLEESRQAMLDGGIQFHVESNRVRKVVVKLARAHAAYELGEPRLEEPKTVIFGAFNLLWLQEVKAFESVPIPTFLPEVGSRAMQRTVEDGPGWVVVQSGNYRYLTMIDGNQMTVRFVLREYLACEVIWQSA